MKTLFSTLLLFFGILSVLPAQKADFSGYIDSGINQDLQSHYPLPMVDKRVELFTNLTTPM